MDDPNLTKDERAVLEKLRTQPGHYGARKERELGTRRAVLNSLQRRGLIRFLGGEEVQLTQAGERAMMGNTKEGT
jgi:hypothetical protein